MGQKKDFSNDRLSDLLGSVREETPIPEQSGQGVGRPKRNVSTSQNGLRMGQTRMTFIVEEELQDKLKYIAFMERISIREIMDVAIRDYLTKYEGIYGEINLNK